VTGHCVVQKHIVLNVIIFVYWTSSLFLQQEKEIQHKCLMCFGFGLFCMYWLIGLGAV